MTTQEYLSDLAETSKKISQDFLNIIDNTSKPKLRVALISYYYQKPTISGVGIHVQNLAKHLVKHNCEVHVFCSGETDGYYKEEGIYVHSIGRILTPTNNSFSNKRMEYDLFESEVIKEISRENLRKKLDIIHTHGALTKSAFILRKVYNLKWVHTFHAIEKLRVKELSNEEKEFGDLISWIESTANYCDGAIFVSKDLMKHGIRNYKLKSKIVIPNGVELNLFKYSPITNKNVLFIGRFSKDKGIDTLLKIIPKIMEVKGATITLVCPYKSMGVELKEIREKLSKQENKYTGRLKVISSPQDQEVLRDLYKKCQVYIQPSKYESFGLCIIEAMATGRPVVAFKVGGIPEVIDNAGFTVKTINRFIYKVKNLLENKKECIKIGKKASQRAREFNWNLIAKKTIEYYNKVRI